MKKKDIRRIYKEKRALLSDEVREQLDRLIHKQILTLSLPIIHYLHHYLPVSEQNEVSVHLIIETLRKKNPELIQIVPVMEGDKMKSVIYNNTMSTQKNQWGISEPVEHLYADLQKIEYILVPLLAFDVNGNRVGYGKGCYDRFLALCNNDVIKIGLSYFEPVTEISDTDKFDIPLNYCVTPERIYEFG